MKQNIPGSTTPPQTEPSEGPETTLCEPKAAEKLRERADKIRLMARRRESLRDEEEKRQEDLNTIRKKTTQAVMNEYDHLKTKDLSNAEKRKNSVELRLERHETYQQLAEEEKTLHTQIALQGIELSYQHRMFLADLAELFANSLTTAFLIGGKA